MNTTFLTYESTMIFIDSIGMQGGLVRQNIYSDLDRILQPPTCYTLLIVMYILKENIFALQVNRYPFKCLPGI